MPLDSNTIRNDQNSHTAIVGAMRTMFANKWASVYSDYAAAICLLSDITAVQGAASHLDLELAKVMNEYLCEAYKLDGKAPKQTLTKALNNDRIVCDGKKFNQLRQVHTGKVPYAKVSVSKLLKRCFAPLGVKGLNTDAQSPVYSDAASQHFVPLVAKGCLFVDGVTAGHGEFTHTIQWLLIAAGQQKNIINVVKDIGELYKDAVSILTTTNLLFEKPGQTNPVDKKTMWDLVVDCFLATESQNGQAQVNIAPPGRNANLIGTYEFTQSLFAISFRAPRLLQYALFDGIPDSEARFAYAKQFVKEAALHRHAPLLSALLRNRHRNKGLAIDMNESDFQKYYTDHSKEKAAKTVEKLNAERKGKPLTVEEFLEETGRDGDHATFVPKV